MDYPVRSGDSEALRNYYRNEFAGRYHDINTIDSISADNLFGKVSDRAKTLQNQYIALNPNPLGSKDKLVSGEQGGEYDALHQTYHPYFTDFIKNFGFTTYSWSMRKAVMWFTAPTKNSISRRHLNQALIKTADWRMLTAAQ